MKGVLDEKFSSRWVCCGCDKFSIFEGHHLKVTLQLKYKVVPFFIGVHYITHQTNLAIVVLSKLPLVSHTGSMLQFIYSFFIHSLKKFLKFAKFVEILV
jgi:hypothetical protein